MGSKNREFRTLAVLPAEGTEYRATGHASTFERYLLWKDPETGAEYYEQFDRGAFDSADMSDCVYRVDHAGPVYARTSAGSLTLGIDGKGLTFDADLSRSPAARAHHEELLAGNYPQASFCFTVREESFDRETRTRHVMKVEKIYDVSPVSFPANPGTDVSARGCLDGVIEAEKAERLEAERREARRMQLELKLRLGG